MEDTFSELTFSQIRVDGKLTLKSIRIDGELAPKTTIVADRPLISDGVTN
jgi:hypothetical protein